MAVTSIWRVSGKGKSGLSRVVDYAKNPDKTANPEYAEKGENDRDNWLSDVIHYATQDKKTQDTIHNEGIEIMRRFVSGVNCSPETVSGEMMAVKLKYGKTDGIIAYHGYQSFAPGEATPETAHEIGIKLAEKLWGEKYQVIVATHLDKANHLHNHFVLNNVSMIDGKKYYRSAKDYYNMQRESDALCREYDLSVIKEPKCGKSKHYAEWQADKKGYPTWRGTVKSDIDIAIRQSMTERQFWDNLRKMGYEIKTGKDISVKPPGKERFVRLCRNFGGDYAIDGICRRILAQSIPERNAAPPVRSQKKVHVRSSNRTVRKVTGLRALYFYYLYRMGVLPKKRGGQSNNPKQAYFLYREDIRHMRDMAFEIRLMSKHNINTVEELTAYRDNAALRISELSDTRKHLRNQTRNIKDEVSLDSVKSEISTLSAQMAGLRREVKLCGNIQSRSVEMKDKIHKAQEPGQIEKYNVKERRKNEQFGRRR